MADAEIVKSRLKAIIDFNEIGNGRTVVRKDVLNDALSVIEELQAEIKRLTKPADGTWIQKADATGHEYSMCSACETVINTPNGCGGYYKLDMTGAKYCPNCGAKMD